MRFAARSAEIEILSVFAFAAVCLGVLIAVIAKAFRKFPYQPDEYKVFTRPTLPRWFSKIYLVHPPPRPRRVRAKNQRHENFNPQRTRRHSR
jgi:hypothetical protein